MCEFCNALASIRDVWPACRPPIVGTKPVVDPVGSVLK